MGYTWTNGELITAEKLNDSEGGTIVVPLEGDYISGYTYNDILALVNAGNYNIVISRVLVTGTMEVYRFTNTVAVLDRIGFVGFFVGQQGLVTKYLALEPTGRATIQEIQP